MVRYAKCRTERRDYVPQNWTRFASRWKLTGRYSYRKSSYIIFKNKIATTDHRMIIVISTQKWFVMRRNVTNHDTCGWRCRWGFFGSESLIWWSRCCGKTISIGIDIVVVVLIKFRHMFCEENEEWNRDVFSDNWHLQTTTEFSRVRRYSYNQTHTRIRTLYLEMYVHTKRMMRQRDRQRNADVLLLGQIQTHIEKGG